MPAGLQTFFTPTSGDGISSSIRIHTPDHTPGTPISPEACQEGTSLFLKHGACLLERALPERWVEEALQTADDAFAHRRDAAGTMGLGLEGGFFNIVQRMEGRYDMLLQEHFAPPFSTVMDLEHAPWGPLLHAILGKPHLMWAGLLVTLPGAAPHPWHSDGPPLFSGPNAPILPPLCINVFIPLVDQTPHNGGTDLRLGTHRTAHPRSAVMWSLTTDPRQDDDLPVSLICPAGSALLFDYRLQHRAHPHQGPERRVVFYLSYAHHWFRDQLNFPSTPYPTR